MKFIFLLSTLFFLQLCYSQEESVFELTEIAEPTELVPTKEEILNDGFTKVYSKTLTKYLKAQGTIINGKKDSLWTYFNQEGIKDSVVDYDEGLRLQMDRYMFDYKTKKPYLLKSYTFTPEFEVMTQFNQNCTDSLQRGFKCLRIEQKRNRKNNDLYTTYYDLFSGKPSKIETNTTAYSYTLLKKWNSEGVLIYESTPLENNKKFVKTYYDTGEIFKTSEYQDKKLYNYKAYKKDGSQLETGNFKNGNGSALQYDYKSEKFIFEFIYKDGEIVKTTKLNG